MPVRAAASPACFLEEAWPPMRRPSQQSAVRTANFTRLRIPRAGVLDGFGQPNLVGQSCSVVP
jgi:hypothetical protein